MKLEEMFDGPMDLLKNIISHRDYGFIRNLADYLLELDEVEFSLKFEYALARAHSIPIPEEENLSLGPLSQNTEAYFLTYLDYKISRAIIIMESVLEHRDNINKPSSEEFNDVYDSYHFKRDFLQLRMRRAVSIHQISELEVSVKKLNINKKQSKQNLLEGKPLNLAERYQIADKVFGIDKIIRGLNISNAEMSKLVGLIFDCNPINARHVFNGKYTANIKEEILDKYVENLNR